MNRLGYGVDTFILDAARFVPQSRQRLFVIGMQHPEQEALRVKDRRRAYAPQSLVSDVKPKALADFILTHPEIAWNIRDLPAQPRLAVGLHNILEDLPHAAPEWWTANGPSICSTR